MRKTRRLKAGLALICLTVLLSGIALGDPPDLPGVVVLDLYAASFPEETLTSGKDPDFMKKKGHLSALYLLRKAR